MKSYGGRCCLQRGILCLSKTAIEHKIQIAKFSSRSTISRIGKHQQSECNNSHLYNPKRRFFNFSKTAKKGDNRMHTYLLRDGNKNLEKSALLAIEDYDQAINMEETSEAYTKRAFAYFYIKDYNQATIDVEHAIQLNPVSIEAYCAAASIDIALNKHESALEHLNTALELTSPVDFRRESIEEVIRGCKLTMRSGDVMQQSQPLATGTGAGVSASTSEEAKIENIENGENIANIDGNTNTSGIQVDGEIVSDETKEEIYKQNASQMVNVPFDDKNFLDLQKDLTQQMVDMGGQEFQKKLAKLNDIPAVQAFQQKALRGERPSYNDYMELMKNPKFKRYNDVMSEIAKNPKFSHVTAKFAQMDWMGAYEELKKDPDALALYMKAFDCLD